MFTFACGESGWRKEGVEKLPEETEAGRQSREGGETRRPSSSLVRSCGSGPGGRGAAASLEDGEAPGPVSKGKIWTLLHGEKTQLPLEPLLGMKGARRGFSGLGSQASTPCPAPPSPWLRTWQSRWVPDSQDRGCPASALEGSIHCLTDGGPEALTGTWLISFSHSAEK